MKKEYTIGETAALLGVSAQTLRYYDKIGLISPGHIDEKTGYRYYFYNQFHYIDRIKYLQSLGMNLKDISNVIHKGEVKLLLKYLKEKHEEETKELKNLNKRIKDIEWYMDYFTYLDNNKKEDNVYRQYFDERYIISVPCFYKEPLAKMEVRLATEKSKEPYANLIFRRQYGYKIDFNSFLKSEFYPRRYFVYLRDKPNIHPDLYEVLPAGEYICFQTPILEENWDINYLKRFFGGKDCPKVALALEFEDNLVDYSKAWYEVQLLI